MQEISIYSMGEMPEFSLTPADEGYYTERLSYELSYMLRQMNVAGMSIKRAEESDFQAFSGSLDTYMATFKTWVNRAYDRSNSRLLVQDLTDLVPSIITTGGTVAAAALSGGGSLLVPMLVNAGLQLVAHVVAGQANNLLTGESENIGDIAEAIREAFLRDRNPEEATISLLAADKDKWLGVADVLRRALLSEHGTGENETIEAVLGRLLEEWRIDFVDDGKRQVSFMASQSVTPLD